IDPVSDNDPKYGGKGGVARRATLVKLTRVARRATPPLPPYLGSLSETGSISECVSLVCRIVIRVSPAATSKSGSAIAARTRCESRVDAAPGSASAAPVTSELFRKLRRLIMALSVPDFLKRICHRDLL